MIDDDTDGDDEALWEELTRSLKPIRKKNTVLAAAKSKKPVIRERAGEPPRFPTVSVQSSPVPAAVQRDLKRQKIPLEGSIDLHGCTQAQAQARLQNFILLAIKNRWRCIEIITGRGNPASGGGQLRRMVPLWLAAPPLGPFILHKTENSRTNGGSLLVLLRRKAFADPA